MINNEKHPKKRLHYISASFLDLNCPKRYCIDAALNQTA